MATLSVKVVPGASRTRIVGRFGDGIRVQVAAAPEKGRANEAVIGLLVEALGINSRDIELISGHGNPRKVFRISGLEQAELDARLASLV